MQEIICILDKSGSMQSVARDALGGLNKFIEDQQKVGEANITIVWFDNDIEFGYEGKLSDLKPFKEWPYEGMTALRDAIGKTFNHVMPRFSLEKPEKVVMAILTDGHENSSKEFSQSQVSKLITDHQENHEWDVIFLAADQDAWETAQHFGIRKSNTINYRSVDTIGGFAEYSKTVACARTK